MLGAADQSNGIIVHEKLHGASVAFARQDFGAEDKGCRRGKGGTASREKKTAEPTEGDSEADAVRLAALSFLATLPE